MTENEFAVRFGGWTLTIRQLQIMLPVFLLRLALAWLLVWTGFDKLLTDWTSAGFLVHSTSGPLEDWFVDLGTNSTAVDVIDGLVISGEILIGIALFVGIAMRFALFWGSVMIFLFYIAQFPPANNPFLDEHIVYLGVFFLLAMVGAGRFLGLDAVIEKLPFVRRIPGIEYLLG
jgi:thiosulfate dehydrogenase [quinone] large subunit